MHQKKLSKQKLWIYVPNFCRNDELSSTMSWVGCLLTDSELFILFAENIQIYSQNFCHSHYLNFHISGSTEPVIKQPTQLIIAAEISHTSFLTSLAVILNELSDSLIFITIYEIISKQ